jgi:hypothetical protein
MTGSSDSNRSESQAGIAIKLTRPKIKVRGEPFVKRNLPKREVASR